MKKHDWMLTLIIALSVFLAAEAFASSVSVDYTYTGTSGDYLLNFNVTNNIPALHEQKIYMWGVSIEPVDIERGFPSGWSLSTAYTLNSTLVYPNGWATISVGDYRIDPGASLSGFTLHTASIPSEIGFIAWAYPFPSDTDWSLLYYESDDVCQGEPTLNPCFTGLVGAGRYIGDEPPSVPEPTTMLLLGLGLVGLAGVRRKLN